MKLRSIIITVVIVLLLAGGIILMARSKSIPDNDSYVTGNSSGNLDNGGLYCEHDGLVYFANPLDNGALYSMNVDETDYKKILDSGVESINVDDNRIYYALSGKSGGTGLGYVRKATGMYSCTHKGGSTMCYTMDPVGIIALSGNNLFYQHYKTGVGTDLDCITTSKKGNITVVENMVSPASVNAGTIYYAGDTDDHYLYALDTTSNLSNVIYEHNMYAPLYVDGDIYYMDLETNYHLHRYNLSTGQDTELTNSRVDKFNVYGTMVYYQTDSSSSSPALMRMNTDGTNPEVVSYGIYCDINITSMYVYYHSYDSAVPTYHQSLYGAINPTEFYPEVQ